jgi:hypothetical protein
MIALNPLCTMTVTLKEPLDAGNVPTGQRVIAEIAGVSLSGRLSGSLAGGGSADWLTMTRGGLGLPDVRMVIRASDNAVVLIRYSGRMRFVPGPDLAHAASPHPAHWADKAGRGVFDKSHNRLASSARRLVIEATYSL